MAMAPIGDSTNEPPTVEDYLRELGHATRRLADIAEMGAWDAPVPTCPGWTVLSLVRHVGGTHRWATDIVANARNGRHREMFGLTAVQRESAQAVAPDDLAAWLRDGWTALDSAIREAPPDLDCWTFMAGPRGREFWARRQLHESGIHSIDGQLALGAADDVAPVPAWVGADGADELLTGFTALPGAALRFPQPRTLAVRTVAPDPGDGIGPAPLTARAWLVTIGPDSIAALRDPDEAALDAADASLAGAPHDVYCVLWNRPPIGEVALEGDVALVDAWHADVRVA